MPGNCGAAAKLWRHARLVPPELLNSGTSSHKDNLKKNVDDHRINKEINTKIKYKKEYCNNEDDIEADNRINDYTEYHATDIRSSNNPNANKYEESNIMKYAPNKTKDKRRDTHSIKPQGYKRIEADERNQLQSKIQNQESNEEQSKKRFKNNIETQNELNSVYDKEKRIYVYTNTYFDKNSNNENDIKNNNYENFLNIIKKKQGKNLSKSMKKSKIQRSLMKKVSDKKIKDLKKRFGPMNVTIITKDKDNHCWQCFKRDMQYFIE